MHAAFTLVSIFTNPSDDGKLSASNLLLPADSHVGPNAYRVCKTNVCVAYTQHPAFAVKQHPVALQYVLYMSVWSTLLCVCMNIVPCETVDSLCFMLLRYCDECVPYITCARKVVR